MLKVEGAIVIFARETRAKFLTTPTFRSNHAHFCINETVRTDTEIPRSANTDEGHFLLSPTL